MNIRNRASLLATVLSLVPTASALAIPFSPQTLISTFGVITHTNFATTSDVRFPVLVGGNLSNSGAGILSSFSPGTPAPPIGYGEINVFGNNSGIWAENGSQHVFLGGANVGAGKFLNPGSFTANYTFPGAAGSPGEGTNAATFDTDIWAPLTSLSASLAALPSSGTFNPATGTFTPAASGVSVWNVTAAQLESAQQNFKFANCLSNIPNPSSCDGVVNVTGGSFNSGVRTFEPLFPLPGLIFNFIDATNITLGNVWEASILAPSANVQTTGGWIDGNVIANSVGGLGAIGQEIHNPLFDCSDNLCTIQPPPPAVPEPGTLALLGTALAASYSTLRRRRAAYRECTV